MGFYQLAPQPLAQMYFDTCDKHNAEPDGRKRADLSLQAHTILGCVDALCGNVAVGRLIMDADLRLPDDGRPACGGRYLDMDKMDGSIVPLMTALSSMCKATA